MRRFLPLLVCAVSLLSTSVDKVQAQVTFPEFPDNPEAPGGGRPVQSYPNTRYNYEGAKFVAPTVSGAKLVNGRVRFTFGASGSDTMKYNIVWLRPGNAEVTDMRWTGPHDGNGKALEDYTINELAPADTIYTFRVQAISKYKRAASNGYIYNGVSYPGWPAGYNETKVVEKSFRTPPRSDRVVKATGKYSDQLVPGTAKTKPFDLKKVETPVRLTPVPVTGTRASTAATPNALRLETGAPVRPLTSSPPLRRN